MLSLPSGNVPPQDLEAERAVLGAILLDDEALVPVSMALKKEDFYDRRNQNLFEACCTLSGEGYRVDLHTLTHHLTVHSKLADAGGAAYLAGLTDVVPSLGNIEYYTSIVLQNSVKRKILKLVQELNAGVFDKTREPEELLEAAQSELYAIMTGGAMSGFNALRKYIPDVISGIERRYHDHTDFTGISSGLPALDNLTSGFQNSELIIIGARPSMGKTALALTMASHMAIKKGIPTAFFSLEMAGILLTQRLIASESGVSNTTLRKGLLKLSDFAAIQNAAGDMYDAPLYINDEPNLRMMDLRITARQICAEKGVKIIFIDYLGLIVSENKQLPRYEQMADISQSLKSLARELNIPIIALSQVGRLAEGTAPSLADIRGSGAIEQDADVVMFLHRDRESSETDLILAKQRNGPIGVIKLEFQASHTRFICKEA